MSILNKILSCFKKTPPTLHYMMKVELTATDKPEVLQLVGTEMATGKVLQDTVLYFSNCTDFTTYSSLDKKNNYSLLTSKLTFIVDGDTP